MAQTKITGGLISTTSNYEVGVITATKFVGPFGDSSDRGIGYFSSLDVTGNANIGGTLSYVDVDNITATGIITAQDSVQIGAGLSVAGISTFTSRVGIADSIVHLGNTDTSIRFPSDDTFSVETAGSERFNISSSGETKFTVGTNKSVKFYAVSHNDETNLGAGLGFSRQSDGAEILSGIFGHSNTGLGVAARDHITFLTGGTSNVSDTEERLRILSDGKVGINTTVPAEKLSVSVDGNQRENFAKFEHIGQQNFFIQGQWGDKDIGGANGTLLYGSGTLALRAATSGNAHLVNLASGNIGIGTLNPGSPLEVSGGTALDTATFNTHHANGVLINIQRSGTSKGFLGSGKNIADATGGVDDIGLRSNANLIFTSGGGTERLRLTSAGDVEFSGATAGVSSCTWDASANTLIFNDDVKAAFGNGSDFTIEHDGSHAYLNTGTGLFYSDSTNHILRNKAGTQDVAKFAEGASGCMLYCSNGVKLTTTTTGISVTGEVAATQDYPNYRPTLDFNFAAAKKLDSRFTYTRSGPASYTDEFGIVKLVGANTPRFDHDPTTRESKGLLIEESRVNKFASSDAGHSAWILNGSITKEANTTDTKDPAGTYTACKLMSVASANSGSQIYDGLSFSSGGVQSLWAKKGTHNVLGIFDYGGGSGIRGWFDLNTGEHRCEGGSKVAAGVQSSGNDSNTTDMIEYPNGWYRCIYYEAANMTYAHFRICDFDSDTEASASSNSIYVWGLQAEDGDVTYATSHIPCNTGAMPGTITRGDETVTMEGEEFTDFYNQEEGTLVLAASYIEDNRTGGIVTIDDTSNTSEYTEVGYRSGGGSSGTVGSYIRTDAGNDQYYKGFTSSATQGNEFKVALAYKDDDYASSVNGQTVDTDTSGTTSKLYDRLRFNHVDSVSPPISSSYIRRFIYYPKRLPNNQVVTLTS